VLEGIASRGDSRAGAFFEEAYRQGCRLDAWTEYLKREVWEALLEKYNDLANEFLDARDTNNNLPWSCVESGLSENFFLTELNKAKNGKFTPSCIKKCNDSCKICNDSVNIVQNSIQAEVNHEVFSEPIKKIPKTDPNTFRIIFSFSKQGTSVFHPHLGIIEILFMAFIRADIPVLYSQGFNPLPRLEIASPLSLGIKAVGEVASIDTEGFFDAEKFKTGINAFLPEGLEVRDAMNIFIPTGKKKHSLSSLLWGYIYAGDNGKDDIVKFIDEKQYRELRLKQGGNLYNLERLSVLAHPGISYFEVYRGLYPEKFLQ
jgi:hypothetical protein